MFNCAQSIWLLRQTARPLDSGTGLFISLFKKQANEKSSCREGQAGDGSCCHLLAGENQHYSEI
jgi:hypothetical protein